MSKKKKKLIGEINGIKVFSSPDVPEDQVWIEESHRPNPVYVGGFLDTIAFTDKSFIVRGKNMLRKLSKLIS